MSQTPELLQSTLTHEITDILVKTLQQAYEENFQCFDPEIGHDAMSFGLMVYKSKVHFIKKLAEEYDWIEILQHTPFFQFKIGPYSFSAYCAGHTATADIESSFPQNRTRAARLVAANKFQLRLPYPGSSEPDDSECREVVLADIGNPSDGLLRMFVGVPIEHSADNRITKWGTAYEIWSKDVAGMPPVTPESELPPVERVVPFPLKIKEVKEISEEK